MTIRMTSILVGLVASVDLVGCDLPISPTNHNYLRLVRRLENTVLNDM
jgi:hypothetical protein